MQTEHILVTDSGDVCELISGVILIIGILRRGIPETEDPSALLQIVQCIAMEMVVQYYGYWLSFERKRTRDDWMLSDHDLPLLYVSVDL